MQQDKFMQEVIFSEVLSDEQIRRSLEQLHKSLKTTDSLDEIILKMRECQSSLIAEYYLTK